MAFPQVSSTNTSSEVSNVTSHTVNLPASISSGDLLIVFFSCDAVETTTWPSSNAWYDGVLVDEVGFNHTCDVVYRIADGTEGSTITVTTGTAEQSEHISYRITAWHGTTPPEAVDDGGVQTNQPDPPSLTPSWGSGDTLWIAGQTNNDGTSTVTTWPTNYTSNQLNPGSGVGSVAVGVATRENATSSENPSAFTITATEHAVAFTIAVRPAAAAPGTPSTLTLLGVG